MSNHDDFFGGSLTPPRTSSPPLDSLPGAGPGPYGGTSVATRQQTPALPIVIGLVGVALAAVVGFLGFRLLFDGPSIELPETILGLEKVDPDSAVGRQVEQALEQTKPFTDQADVAVEGAMYGGQDRMVFALGGDKGTEDPNEVSDYFTGFESGFAQWLPNATQTQVPAGPLGGEMRCGTSQSVGVCAWIDGDTFGAFVLGPAPEDLATTALEVRASIEK
jgi:hypothetical protein